MDNLKAVGKMAQGDGFRVIAVSLGRDADVKELMALTSGEDDIMNVTIGEKPEGSAKAVMDKVFGMCHYFATVVCIDVRTTQTKVKSI